MKCLPIYQYKKLLSLKSHQNILNIKSIQKKISSIYFSLIFISLISVLLCIPHKEKPKLQFYFQSNSNEITIKIQGKGNQYVISPHYPYSTPNLVYLNDVLVSENANTKIINIPTDGEEINSIKLVWNTELTNMHRMFNSQANLLEVDLSNCDSSKVVSMLEMFGGSNSLKVVNFNNLNTESVVDMASMFYGCSSLLQLDLSSFITSNVVSITQMFRGMSNIKYLNLSNFDLSKATSFFALFYDCYALISVDISNFDARNVNRMDYMFGNCHNLISLDLSRLNTAQVENMDYIFLNCVSLKVLDLTNFNTAKIVRMKEMFKFCKQLQSLNLSSFDTSQVVNMEEMFRGCESLTVLDVSKFDTSKVVNMQSMFYECKRLPSLDITNFDTTQVIDMHDMFYHCESLTSLDLSNFRTPNLKAMNAMFDSTYVLTSIDLTNFDTSQVTNMRYMFCHDAGLAHINVSTFKTDQVTDMESMFGGCTALTSIDVTSFDTSKVFSMKLMFFGCETLKELNLSSFETTSINTLETIFGNCFNLEYINFNLFNEVRTFVFGGILSGIRDNIVICINENNAVTDFKAHILLKRCHTIYCPEDWRKYIKRINPITLACEEIIETTSVVTTYNNIESTNIDTTYKPEEEKKEDSTNIASTNNDMEENDISTNIISSNSHSTNMDNIISSSSQNNNVEEERDSDSTSIKTSSVKELSSQISNEAASISSSILTHLIHNENTFEEIIKIKTYIITGENNGEIYNKIINNILRSLIVTLEDELLIEGVNNHIYELTTSQKDKNIINGINNSTNTLSKIDLGECENLLKNYYHIDNNIPLIILKYEKVTNNSLERELQYEIYDPISKKKLNLSICNDITIDIYTPVILSDELLSIYNELKEKGYDLFDINSAFYQDICTPFTTPEGTDILLSDRITYYFNNNETLCQSNCKFSEYSIDAQLLKCECDISNSDIDINTDDKFSKKNLYQGFYNTLKFSNYKVLLCYKLAFHINSITINKGSIIAIILFLFYFVFLIIFCVKGITKLKLEIAKLIFKKKKKVNNDLIEEIDLDNKIKGNFERFPSSNTLISDYNKTKSEKQRSIKTSKFKVNLPPKKNSGSTKTFSGIKSSSRKLTSDVQITSKINEDNKQDSNTLNNKNNNNNKEMTETNSEIMESIPGKQLDNFELNNLEYNMAIILDKRHFIRIYWSLLKREHLLIFTFFVRNDHNLIYIKFARFIFLIATDMALNVFFFSDETMHEMYKEKGNYDFIQQLAQIIYSTIVAQIIEVFLCFLSMTDKHYYEIKNLEIKNRYDMFAIIKCIKRKLIFFFVITCLLFAFYWYAIACFCAVYVNTQSAFIKDSISSFVISLLYPLVLYLFPSLFRLISLRCEKSNLSWLYTMSDIIPFF